jgi:hypothetical protein
MTVKDKKDVAGKALYLEFRKGSYTYQTVLTPLTITADNSSSVPFKILRRRISVWHPRRNWSADLSQKRDFSRDAYGAFEKNNFDSRSDDLKELIGNLYGSQFTQLVNQGWSLFKTPLVAEFTYEELETVASGKMPVSLYRRFERVRKNQGWPAELVNPEATTV